MWGRGGDIIFSIWSPSCSIFFFRLNVSIVVIKRIKWMLLETMKLESIVVLPQGTNKTHATMSIMRHETASAIADLLQLCMILQSCPKTSILRQSKLIWSEKRLVRRVIPMEKARPNSPDKRSNAIMTGYNTRTLQATRMRYIPIQIMTTPLEIIEKMDQSFPFRSAFGSLVEEKWSVRTAAAILQRHRSAATMRRSANAAWALSDWAGGMPGQLLKLFGHSCFAYNSGGISEA